MWQKKLSVAANGLALMAVTCDPTAVQQLKWFSIHSKYFYKQQVKRNVLSLIDSLLTKQTTHRYYDPI